MIDNKMLFIIIFILIFLIIIIYISCFYPDNSIISKFSTRLPIASQLIIGIGILITYLIFNITILRSNIDITLLTQEKGFSNIIKVLSEKYKDCPQFVDSLSYDYKNTRTNTKDSCTQPGESFQAKQYIAFLIFQSIEDYFCTWNITESSDSEWFCTYLIWMSSKQIQDIWYNTGIPFFGKKTKAYVEFLFDINKKYKFKNTLEMIDFSEKIIRTKEFTNMVLTPDDTNLKYIL